MKYKFLLLSIISGALLWLGWPTFSSTYLLFFGFSPLLYIEDELTKSNKKGYWLYTLLAMFIWNVSTTWWVSNATIGGGLTAVIANSLLMTLPFLAFRKTKSVIGPRIGYLSLVIYWIGFEYLHLNWDISWPWLTIGNAFSEKTWWVQWYEYTGTLGGSVWVLLVNIIVFKQIQFLKGRISFPLIRIALSVLIPIVISILIGKGIAEDGKVIKVASVQPSIDPYSEKFYTEPQDQVNKMVFMTEGAIAAQPDIDLVLWPETAIQGNNEESQIEVNSLFLSLQAMVSRYPEQSYLMGMESWDRVSEDSNPAYTKRSKNGAYQYFNTGLWLQDSLYSFYHKSRFVPGAEMLPFPKVLGFFGSIINFAQTGAYAPQSDRPVYTTKKGVTVAPIICYESIYGDFVSEYVRNGADALTVITNDGWWDDTEGHRHHNMYGRLRAIEFRRPVIRCANTGISSFIDIVGREKKRAGWWDKTVLIGKLKSSTKMTFYAKHGDYLGRILAFLSVILFVSTLVRKKTEKYK